MFPDLVSVVAGAVVFACGFYIGRSFGYRAGRADERRRWRMISRTDYPRRVDP